MKSFKKDLSFEKMVIKKLNGSFNKISPEDRKTIREMSACQEIKGTSKVRKEEDY